MFAEHKSDPTAAKPVTNSDCDQSTAAVVLCQSVYQTPAVLNYFHTSNPSSSQQGVLRMDAYEWRTKSNGKLKPTI